MFTLTLPLHVQHTYPTFSCAYVQHNCHRNLYVSRNLHKVSNIWKYPDDNSRVFSTCTVLHHNIIYQSLYLTSWRGNSLAYSCTPIRYWMFTSNLSASVHRAQTISKRHIMKEKKKGLMEYWLADTNMIYVHFLAASKKVINNNNGQALLTPCEGKSMPNQYHCVLYETVQK